MAQVDIFLPTYQPSPQHLTEALESVLRQTCTDWHLYILDEPTAVDTKIIVRPYLDDKRISFVQNTERKGIGGNWNACLQYGNAPIVQFLFQDDLWEPGFLETGLRVLKEHSEVGFVSMNHDYFQDGWDVTEHTCVRALRETLLSERVYTGEETRALWMNKGLHCNFIGEPPFVMLRRSLVESVGTFNESMMHLIDLEFWLRCTMHTNWYFVPEILGSFRVHTGSQSFRNSATNVAFYERHACFYILQVYILSMKERTDLVRKCVKRHADITSALLASHAHMQTAQENIRSMKARLYAKSMWMLVRNGLVHPLFATRCLLRFFQLQQEKKRSYHSGILPKGVAMQNAVGAKQ